MRVEQKGDLPWTQISSSPEITKRRLNVTKIGIKTIFYSFF